MRRRGENPYDSTKQMSNCSFTAEKVIAGSSTKVSEYRELLPLLSPQNTKWSIKTQSPQSITLKVENWSIVQ